MRLELHEGGIRRIQWGERTGAWNGVLTVNREEAAAEVAKDERFASVRLDLAHPGEKVRIIPVKDVVEPRVKLARSGEPLGYFPGFFAPAGTAGKGVTLVLRGAAVVTCGPIVAFQEGFIDMSGPGAAYTPFSETANLVLTVEPDPRLTKHAYEEALRLAGLRLAVYLATAARNVTPDAISVYEKGNE
jgi:glycine reductase